MKAFFDRNNSNNKVEQAIQQIIGEPYDVWELLEMPPIRSGNLIIHELLIHDLTLNDSHADLWHCNIEIRKKGIEIVLRGNNHHYSWCIPFYQLTTFQSTHLTIHSNGFFIRLKNGYTMKQQFFKRLIKLKNDYLNNLREGFL